MQKNYMFIAAILSELHAPWQPVMQGYIIGLTTLKGLVNNMASTSLPKRYRKQFFDTFYTLYISLIDAEQSHIFFANSII